MKVTLREAVPSDAERIINYIQRLSEEPVSNIVIAPGEFAPSIEDEERILSEFASSKNSILIGSRNRRKNHWNPQLQG